MKIVKLTSENIKKLTAIEITPTGSVVRITGKNAQGKTSVLDSIWWALGGTENVQAQPIRRGEKKAKVELDLGEMIVRRTFTESGTALVVENAEGMRYTSPQSMLDKLIGKLAFDPLEFMRMKPKQQFETLRDLTGVDLSELDAKRQQIYDERTRANKAATEAESAWKLAVVPQDAPDVEESVAGVLAEIEKVQAAVTERDRVVERGKALVEKKEDLIRRIAALQSELDVVDSTVQELRKAAMADVPDLAALKTKLASVETRNSAARMKSEKARLHFDATKKEKAAAELTEKIAEIDAEKTAKISAAKFPLEGLAFGSGSVLYSGLPLEQASSAEQLRVSMAMAMSLNPKLRVIRITDGSLLDSDSMKVIEDLAQANDYQVWIESVDESGKIGIVIEDGHVAAVDGVPT